MQPIQMTREEYRKKYGVEPYSSKESDIDIRPAPRRMTREQYEEEFGTLAPSSTQTTAMQLQPPAPSETPISDRMIPYVKYNPEKTGISNIPKAIINIPHEVASAVETTLKVPAEGYKLFKESQEQGYKSSDMAQGFTQGLYEYGIKKPILDPLTTVGNTVLGGIQSAVNKLTGIKLKDKAAQEAWDNKVENLYGTFQGIQQMLVEKPLATAEITSKTAQQVGIIPKGTNAMSGVAAPVLRPFEVAREKLKTSRAEGYVPKVADEIYNVENQYSDLRKANNKEYDGGKASRERIARSGVLEGSVQEGIIRTNYRNGPAEQYAKRFTEPYESTVRDNVAREGKTVNLVEVERYLNDIVYDSGLEGAKLTKAIKGVAQEIEGLSKRADPMGNIKLEKIHDAKLDMKSDIDYVKDKKGTIKYRKAIARGYKEIVENKSKVVIEIGNKKYKVKDINKELSKYYNDLGRIKKLDGGRVKGAKLGKYTAQISGNIAGLAVGSMFGPLAMPVTTVIGGEVAGFLKGKQMGSTFSGTKGLEVPKNELLERAVAQGKLPPEINLKVADKAVGGPKGIEKTPEIIKTEAKIKKNVLEQKKAIKKGDFELVATLKIIYQTLVEKLKELIGVNIKNKEGGFVQIQSNKDGNLNTQYNKTAIAKTTAIEPNNTTSLKLKKDLVIKDVTGNKNTIPAGTLIKAGQGKGSNMVLSVGDKTFTVNKGQFDNLKGQSITGEAKKFAPELEGTEEVILVAKDPATKGMTQAERVEARKSVPYEKTTKYSQYTLPNGKNYREILIKAPEQKFEPDVWAKNWYNKSFDKLTKAEKETITKNFEASKKSPTSTFKSSHWDEPNVISHLRINDRTYNGKKLTFMEELQSDWAREGRDKGFATEITKDTAKQQGFRVDKKKTNMGNEAYFIDNPSDPYMYRKGIPNEGFPTEESAWNALTNKLKTSSTAVPNHPLLKNWQVPTIKRALKDAVDNGADYFAWINGEQTSARYNLATHVDEVGWNKATKIEAGTGKEIPVRNIGIKAKEGKDISLEVDNNGKITNSYSQRDWEGKKLDEVLGKGLADKIMEKESGTLAGDGLKFGGEWANNLYDKQVKNIVEDLTGAKVKEFDLGLPVEGKKDLGFMNFENGRMTTLTEPKDLKVGKELVNKSGNRYIITDVLGDGKFKAISKSNMKPGESIESFLKFAKEQPGGVETFDISQKTTKQQGIELTPEVKSIIKGESPLRNGGFINPALLAGVTIGIPLIYELFFNPDRQVNKPKDKLEVIEVRNVGKMGYPKGYPAPKGEEALNYENFNKDKIAQESLGKATQTQIQSYVPDKYVPLINEVTKEGVISPNALVALINTENGEWKEEYVNPEGTDTGLGQHNDNTYEDINPLFKAKYGRDYDRKNGDDNIKATALWMNHLVQNYPHIKTIDDVVGAYRVGATGYKRYLEGKGTDAFTPAELKSMVEDKQKSFREFYNA